MADEERRLHLVRYEPVRLNFWYYSAWRIRIECTEAQGDDLDKYIFIWKYGDLNPYSGNRESVAQAVCGTTDIADLPIGEPDPDRRWPFYRLDFIEFDVPAKSMAQNVWDIVRHEAQVLATATMEFSNLEEVERLWVPTPPDTGDSESESV